MKIVATENEIELLLQQVKELITSDINQAKDKAERALKISQDKKYVPGLITSYRYLGMLSDQNGRLNEALELYNSSLQEAMNANDMQAQARSYNDIGIICFKTGNYPKAINFFLQSLTIKESLGDTKGAAASLDNLGVLYEKLGDFRQAIEMHKKSLGMALELNDVIKVADCYHNIAISNWRVNELDDALKNCMHSIEYRIQSDEKRKLINTYGLLGEIYLQRKELELAENYLQKAFDLCRQYGTQSELCQSYVHLAKVNTSKNLFEAASELNNKALSIARELDNPDYIMAILLETSAMHEKMKQYEEALKFHKEYASLRSEVLNTENARQVNELRTRYDVESKEKEAQIHRLKNIELKEALDDLQKEKLRSDELLKNILPDEVAEELKQFGKSTARNYELATVLFADIKDFTLYSQRFNATQLVEGLDFYFKHFDDIIDKYNIEKIKTIGDAYLCVGGIPVADDKNPVYVVQAAIEMRNFVAETFNGRTRNHLPAFHFRFGINSGPLVSGIVGKKKFAFDIWGDTVNLAARMEQNGEVGRINVSANTYALIGNTFHCTKRGKIEAKNKGALDMYFVDAKPQTH